MRVINDFLHPDKPPKDRIIREVYTPKEIVHIIRETFDYLNHSGLSYSERLLVSVAFNTLIGEFKDD